ncbi:SnoaL-like domain-containing protein [Nonomuraea solani]|uniref:SnoaL-like domain-containing protein n=1 Tax=Nonomuraea solani TaxID=1144553 RepID=A0A1H6ETF0_9ACTN|nr:nuclear transport factor 2 family protein [Nonomuraea solani]SEG99964.1 SnoaL-like domain-containing protein [Nonomuraea solani]
MPTTNVRELFDTYAATFATRDLDAIVALHSPATMFWLHNGEQPVHGRAALRDTFAAMFAQWPEMGFDVHRAITGDGHWILDWALTAVLTGPGGDRRPIRFDCLDVVTLDKDGLVERKDTFIDLPQAQAALTAASTTGSRS